MKTLKEITRGILIAYVIIWSIVLIGYLVGGCTPQKRLDRLVKKHPHLSKIDTVKVTDTFQVMVPGIRADTNMQKATFLSALKDTIVLQKEQLTVKIYEYRDSVFLDAKCDTVYKTVVREIAVPYPTVTPNSKESWLGYLIAFLVVVVVFVVILRWGLR